jgi:hypothetical protein
MEQRFLFLFCLIFKQETLWLFDAIVEEALDVVVQSSTERRIRRFFGWICG